MVVDIAMFSIMGLAVAYLVRRMGDGAPLALVACAAALLTVVGLSIVLAVIGGRPVEGSYETAVARFVGSLVGAFVGVLLASRHRSLIASGADLSVLVSDKSIGPVLAGAFIVGITILELYRAGFWGEGVIPSSGYGARIPLAATASLPAVSTPTVSASSDERSRVPDARKTNGGASGQTPASSNKSAAPAQMPAKVANVGAPASMQAQTPAEKKSTAGQSAEPKQAQGSAAPPSTSSANAEKTEGAQSNRTEGSQTQVAALPRDTQPLRQASAPPPAALDSSVQSQSFDGGSKGSAKSAAGQSPAPAATCNWYVFANLVRTCVALPCEDCRGQREARRALKDHNGDGFSQGLHDCFSQTHVDMGPPDRCTQADGTRAMAYARFFMAHPHAPVPKDPY